MSTDPSAPRRRRMPASQRRALIADRAAEVFAEHGYDQATIDEIARRSGISAPVLYDHFPAKLALYRHVLDLEYERLRDTWHRSLTGSRPLRERVETAVDAWFAHVGDRPGAIPLYFRVPAADPAARRAQVEATATSRGALRPLIHDLLGPDVGDLEAHLLGEVIAASLRALALWWHDHPDTPRAELVTAAMAALWTGLEQRARARP